MLYIKCAVLFALSIFLHGCGDSTVTSSDVAVCRKVEMHGDSITLQAKQTIAEFLPCYAIENHGVGGAKASQMPLPKWDSETVYTISYGANECLNKVPVESYRLTLHMIGGYVKWRVTPEIILYQLTIRK